jgi:putative heme-binding domain-containing protein
MGLTLDNRLLGVQMLVGGDGEFQRLLAVASDSQQKTSVRSEALWLLRHWEKQLGLNPVTGSFDVQFAGSRRSVSAEIRKQLAADLLAMASAENGDFLPEVLETVESFKISIPETVKRRIFEGVKNPITARLQAMEALGPVPDVLQAALRDPSLEIRMLGLQWLLKQDEAAGFAHAGERLKDGTPREQQMVVALLGGVPSGGATAQINTMLQNWDSLPDVIRADLWAVAAERKGCEESFKTLRARLSKTGDSLAEFRAALAGGDPVRGRKMFYELPAAMCATCHTAEAGVPGGTAGPLLEKVAVRGEEYLLRSLVEPSAEFAPGYAALTLTLKGGETAAGVLWKRDDTGVELKLADGKIRNIPAAQIQKMETPVSPMPPMGQILNLGQIRDLVAFLKTLTPENRDLLASKKVKPMELVQRSAGYLDVIKAPEKKP